MHLQSQAVWDTERLEPRFEAAAEEKAPEVDTGKEKTIVAHVSAPVGTLVPKASVLQTAEDLGIDCLISWP